VSEENLKKMIQFSNDCLKLRRMNFCEFGTMFKCAAGTVWEEQRLCRYARKSSGGERCMHYRRNIGGHCDCVPAQIEASRSLRRRDRS
jgi:hypothetical protein